MVIMHAKGKQAAAPDASAAAQELKLELAVIRAVAGVASAADYPRGKTDAKLNSNRVLVHLESGQKIDAHCSPQLPTKLHAAREAKRQLGEIVGPAAISEAEALVAARMGGASSSGAASFFERSQAAQQKQAQQRQLKEQLQQARRRLGELRLAESAAAAAREAAEEELQRLQAALDEMSVEPVRVCQLCAAPLAQHPLASARPWRGRILHAQEAKFAPNPTQIRPRGAENEPSDDRPHRLPSQDPKRPCAPPAAAAAAATVRAHASGENPPHWAEFEYYSRTTYEGLEVKEQKRRAVEVDLTRRDGPRALPPGDESRGWHNHWRRGIYGALQSWAQGSFGAIVYMLACCARHFQCVDEVSSPRPLPARSTSSHRLWLVCALAAWRGVGAHAIGRRDEALQALQVHNRRAYPPRPAAA